MFVRSIGFQVVGDLGNRMKVPLVPPLLVFLFAESDHLFIYCCVPERTTIWNGKELSGEEASPQSSSFDRSVPMKSCEIKRVHQKRGGEGKQGRWTEIKADMGERDEKKSFVRTCV